MSEKLMPNAEKTAASFGTSTRRTPVRRAAPQALIGPAPPNAAIVVSSGSSTRCAKDPAIVAK
jgi:hypothetical protein